MVTIIAIRKNVNSKEEEFISLILQGEIDLVQSKETGNYYATARRASITSTFDERTAEGLVGSKLPGVIEKVESEPYDYTVKETGESIKLSHKFEYKPENKLHFITIPVFFVGAEDDGVNPVSETISMFEKANEPKDLHIVKGASHYAVYEGELFEDVASRELVWFDKYLKA